LMNPIISLIPFVGSALMAYYTYENYKYVNVCLPGVFHCERFNFIVPRRIRLALSLGASIVLAIIGVLIIINLILIAAVLSIIGIIIGAYGIYLQVSHNAYCMYCLTTDAILIITAIMLIPNII